MLSNSVKVAIVVGITVICVSVIAGLVSIQLTGGDEGVLVRNLGLIASFLITGIPILITSIRGKERTDQIGHQTDNIADKVSQIEMKVNGNLQEAVVQGTTQGVMQAVQIIRGQDAQQKAIDEGGQGGKDGDVQSG